MSLKELLFNVLEELGDDEFKIFKWFLLEENISKKVLDGADRQDTLDAIMGHHSPQAAQVVMRVLEKIRRHDLVENLRSSMSARESDPDFNQYRRSPVEVLQRVSVATASAGARTTASDKYNHITYKELVHSGSPSVYQLFPVKDFIGHIRRVTLGEKDLTMTNRTLLLVGEAGTGKSTIINALVNHVLGVTWEDNVWFEVVEEERRLVDVQTSDVVLYEIFNLGGKTQPFSLTIIDTPGYGDIKATHRDNAIRRKLFDLFQGGVHELNAVGLVLIAGCNRLSDRLSYVLDSVMSLFGKDMKTKIVSLITHSDGTKPKNILKALDTANIKCAKDKKNQPVHFLLNNCQNKDRTEDTEALLTAYRTTANGMGQFFDFLKNSEPQRIEVTVEVLRERNALSACIQNLQERVQFIILKQEEIQRTKKTLKRHEKELKIVAEQLQWGLEMQRDIQDMQDALRRYEEEMKRNENFIVMVNEPYKSKEPINGGRRWYTLWTCYEGATCCIACEENCHYPGCTVAWRPDTCAVMKFGRCMACEKNCPVFHHVKELWRYVTKTRVVQKTLQDMKKKYLEGVANCARVRTRLEDLEKDQINVGHVKEMYMSIKAECNDMASLLEALKEEKEMHQKVKVLCLQDSFRHVLRLEQIALNVNARSTHVHLEFLIEQFWEIGDQEKVIKLVEIQSRLAEDEGDALRMGFSGVKFPN